MLIAINVMLRFLRVTVMKNVNDHDYTDIVTNPPIRAGKVVIYKIFEQAKEHLVENGNLWVVIRKQQGGESALRKIREVFGQW